MKKYILSLILLASFLLIGSVTAQAMTATYYVTESGTGNGSGTSCSGSSPESMAWLNTSSSWGTGTGQIGPGDTVVLCGTITTGIVIFGSGTSVNPITILFGPGAIMSSLAWSGLSSLSGGNVIALNGQSYITIDGGATCQIGGYTGNSSCVNGIIEATENGTGSANGGTYPNQNDIGGVGGSTSGSSNITVQNLEIENLYVRLSGSNDNQGSGVAVQTYGNANTNWLVNNCIFHDMQIGFGAGYGSGYQNITYSNSTAYDVSWGGNAGDTSSSSSMTNLVVKDNYFHDFAPWNSGNDNYHENGFYAWAQNGGTLSSVTYNGNVITNYGTNNSSGLFLSVYDNTTGTYNLYNNLFIGTGTGSPACGDIYIEIASGSTVNIYNNTMVGTGGSGINISGDSYTSGSAYYNIENNIIENRTAIFGAYLWGPNANLPGGTVLKASNNLYYNLSSADFSWSTTGSQSICSWSTCWNCTTSGCQSFDQGSKDGVNPDLNSNYVPESGSPAIGAGANLYSYFTTDINGNLRSSTGAWDIGAFSSTTSAATVDYGDINGAANGAVTVADAELTAEAVVGLVTLNSTQLLAAEVDGTGKLDIYDAYLIAEYAAGHITTFPVKQ